MTKLKTLCLALLGAAVLPAQTQPTPIFDNNVVIVTGTKFSGTIVATVASVQPAGVTVASGATLTVYGGVLSSSLYPGLYSVTYYANSIPTKTASWSVPVSTTAVTVRQIESGAVVSPLHPFTYELISGLPLGGIPIGGPAGIAITSASSLGAVASVFGRTGAVTAQSGDYSAIYQAVISGAPSTWPSTFAPPAASAGALGGVNSKDCSGTGAVQKINTDGSITCGATGSSTRTWPWTFQGLQQAGVTGFTANLPNANAPTPTNVGGTDPGAVLEWPTAQSTYYAYWSFALPSGYVANSNISYIIESRSTDSTHAAILTPYWACVSTTTVDAPSWTGVSTVNITGAATSGRVVTTGTIAPTCSTGNRAMVKFKVDTNTNSMTGPFDLYSVTFSVQGGM